MVLLFDNATMDFGDQTRARQAAAQFIDANAGPNRLMAIINYAGSISVAQNFTADADRLKKVVAGVKFSPTSPNQPVEVASTGMPNLGRAEASFGAMGRAAGRAQHGQAAGAHTWPQDGRVADFRFPGAHRDYVGADRRDCRSAIARTWPSTPSTYAVW